MAYTGCEIKQIGIKHPTLGSLVLFPKAGENSQIEPGGLNTESDPAGITASGEPIYKTSMKRWVVEVSPIAWKRNVSSDNLKTIKNLTASFEECDLTFELADGTIYSGKGKPVGDTKGATLDATIPLKFEGGGNLDKI